MTIWTDETKIVASDGTSTIDEAAQRGEPTSERAPVSVSVDNNHCKLFALCQQEAPDVFELGVDGRLRYSPHPEPAHTGQVLQAARCCPKQAITISRRNG